MHASFYSKYKPLFSESHSTLFTQMYEHERIAVVFLGMFIVCRVLNVCVGHQGVGL